MKVHYVPQVKTRRQKYWTTLGLDMNGSEALFMMLNCADPEMTMMRVLRVTMDREPEPAMEWPRK